MHDIVKHFVVWKSSNIDDEELFKCLLRSIFSVWQGWKNNKGEPLYFDM